MLTPNRYEDHCYKVIGYFESSVIAGYFSNELMLNDSIEFRQKHYPNYIEVKSVLKSLKGDKPILTNTFSVLCVDALLTYQRFFLYGSKKPLTLIDIGYYNHVPQYIFDDNGTIRKFPEFPDLPPEMNRTALFNDPTEMDNHISWLTIQSDSDWIIDNHVSS